MWEEYLLSMDTNIPPMSASRFEYPDFPAHTDFVKRYRFYSDLEGFLRAMARLDGTFDTFITEAPHMDGRLIRARRDLSLRVFDAKSGEFVRIGELSDFPEANVSSIDLELALSYSYLNERYDRVVFKGDVFLMRASLEVDVLTLRICLVDGLGRTSGGMVAQMVVDALRRHLI